MKYILLDISRETILHELFVLNSKIFKFSFKLKLILLDISRIKIMQLSFIF